MAHEDHIAPVGFAREPRTERSRWFRRIALFIFVGFIAWMLVSRVLPSPETVNRPNPGSSTSLPGPL